MLHTHTRTHMDSHSHTQKVFVEGTDLESAYYPYISVFNCSSAYSLRQLNDNHIACTPHTSHHTDHTHHTQHTDHTADHSDHTDHTDHTDHRSRRLQIQDHKHTPHTHMYTLSYATSICGRPRLGCCLLP